MPSVPTAYSLICRHGDLDLDWFEKLTGFIETDYASTRAKLKVRSGKLISLVNDMTYNTGLLELASLSDLRNQVRLAHAVSGRLRVSLISGDVREMHWHRAFAGALFQVASQFNLLEMIGPNKTPEDGVTIYQNDGTQGPACAMAAGAATIYRNYFAKVGGRLGQTRDRQLDALADLGTTLRERLASDVGELWSMVNGYALAHRSGLDAITRVLEGIRVYSSKTAQNGLPGDSLRRASAIDAPKKAHDLDSRQLAD